MTRILLCAALLIGLAVQAAPFADPTRPPAMSGSVSDGGSGRPRLESILIAPDRRLAVIDGEQVTLGSKVAGGAVVRITATEVVLRGPDGEQTLSLFPGVRSSVAPTRKGKSP